MQRVDLTGEVFQRLRDNNLMIDKTQGSVGVQSSWNETKQWMLQDRHKVPPQWADDDVNIPDQPHGRGYPILGPIQRIVDEGQTEDTFRFPTAAEIGAQQIEEFIKKQGTDALAWYRPFHMDPPERWGITILDRGIWYMASNLATMMYSDKSYTEYTDNEIQHCRDIALDFLYHHEMFHFKVELAATMMEMIDSSKPLYARYWSPQSNEEWFGSQVKSHRLVKAPLEEALANSYALDKVCSEFTRKDGVNVRNAIKEFMKAQPPGYKHAWRLNVREDNWRFAIHELIDKLLNQEASQEFSHPVRGGMIQRMLASDVLFDGAVGKEDWIEGYYEDIVPYRILDTGFADARFSKSTDGLDKNLGAFCMTGPCRREYKSAPRVIKQDLVVALSQDWLPSEERFSPESTKRREYKGTQGKWNKNPKRVREFRVERGRDKWRAYEEKFIPTGERILRKMHVKGSKNEQTRQINLLRPAIDPDKIKTHNIDCEHKP